MATTPILGITEVAENQNSKHITINDGFVQLESSVNARFDVDMSGGSDVTLTELDYTTYYIYRAIDATGIQKLIVPDSVNGVTTSRTLFVTNDSGSFDLEVEAGVAPANTITVPAGGKALLHVAGDTITSLFAAGGGASATGDEVIMGIFVPGTLGNAAELLRHVFVRAVDFPDEFVGARGSVGTNPVAVNNFTVSRNAVAIGNIAISTGGVFTFTTIAATVESFAVGDILTITNQVTADANLADVGVTLFGKKV